jgi:diguanylate cyclase (GGDEF)-like protein
VLHNASIVVVDDEPDVLSMVSDHLGRDGYHVSRCSNGSELDRTLDSAAQDLVVLDVNLPDEDGISIARRLQATRRLPIVMLTALGDPIDRVVGLEVGADDYITKPFDISELVARVKAVLRRTQAARDLSPLTGLPGNFRIGQEIENRIGTGAPFALVHCDLDNFKAFNDHYGFMRGDEVIRFCARCLGAATDEIGEMDAFVGHIGGDDFVALVTAERAEEYCKRVIDRFDDGILDYYDTADALRGYIEVIDRRGERYAFPMVSISLGVVTNVHRPIASQWEASAIAVEMKEFAKKRTGSSFEIDRRTN